MLLFMGWKRSRACFGKRKERKWAGGCSRSAEARNRCVCIGTRRQTLWNAAWCGARRSTGVGSQMSLEGAETITNKSRMKPMLKGKGVFVVETNVR
jgi:hypothetical protein